MSSPLEGFMFEIRPTRVSLVKRPANKRNFLVTKSEEERMDEIIQIITETEAPDEQKLVEALKAQGKDDGAVAAILSVARTLSAYRESLTDDDFKAIAKSVRFDADASEEEADEPVEKEEEAAEEEAEEPAEEPAEAEAEEEAEAEPEVEAEKSENPEVVELRKKLAELEAKSRRSEIAELVGDLKVGKQAEELVDVLKAAEDAGADIAPMIEVLRAADTIVRKSFEEIGSDLPGDVNADAYAKIERQARQIAKEQNISFYAALKAVNETNPELLTDYYKEEN